MRAQNDLRRAAAFGDFFACDADTGGFKFIPCFFAEARPFAFKPPSGFLPSLRCHAGDLAIWLHHTRFVWEYSRFYLPWLICPLFNGGTAVNALWLQTILA